MWAGTASSRSCWPGFVLLLFNFFLVKMFCSGEESLEDMIWSDLKVFGGVCSETVSQCPGQDCDQGQGQEAARKVSAAGRKQNMNRLVTGHAENWWVQTMGNIVNTNQYQIY